MKSFITIAIIVCLTSICFGQERQEWHWTNSAGFYTGYNVHVNHFDVPDDAPDNCMVREKLYWQCLQTGGTGDEDNEQLFAYITETGLQAVSVYENQIRGITQPYYWPTDDIEEYHYHVDLTDDDTQVWVHHTQFIPGYPFFFDNVSFTVEAWGWVEVAQE